MTGAIAGDIIGSVYEFDNIKTTDFPLFTDESDYTDDTIMTVAVADWLLNGGDLVKVMQQYSAEYPCPMGGYGGRFSYWLMEENPLPYNSWGNGSAMRVSAVGWKFDSLEKTLEVAKETAIVSHNHPEGIKGAQATAAAIYLARSGKSKQEIKQYIETVFSYDLDRTCDDFVRTILLMLVAREPFPKRSSPFWIVRISSMPSVWLFRWVAIAIRWLA